MIVNTQALYLIDTADKLFMWKIFNIYGVGVGGGGGVLN